MVEVVLKSPKWGTTLPRPQQQWLGVSQTLPLICERFESTKINHEGSSVARCIIAALIPVIHP